MHRFWKLSSGKESFHGTVNSWERVPRRSQSLVEGASVELFGPVSRGLLGSRS